MKPRVGVLNVTGYIGMELARLLFRHPGVELVSVTGRGAVGQRLGEALPHLEGGELAITAEPGEVDLLFSCLPHKTSADATLKALERGARAIDLSADFRLKDEGEYREWYEVAHPAPQWLKTAVYGLPELKRSQLPSARLVANPGCYATAAILALAPLVKEGLIEGAIIIDAKSGVSGGGRTLSLTTHFAEVNENVTAYALEGHRHLPEIVQELQAINPALPLAITFLPHLIPMTRGILCSCYAPPTTSLSQKQLLGLYRDFYKDSPFLQVVDYSPQTKYTLGSNLCLVHPTLDPRTGRVIVLSCLDNLVKGGAGQATQNMNLMLGFDEGLGLEGAGLFP